MILLLSEKITIEGNLLYTLFPTKARTTKDSCRMDRVELQIRLNKEIGIHSLQFIHIDRVSLRRFSIHIAS